MKNKEIEELLKGMRDVSNTEGACMNLDRYLVKLLLSYIEQLENNRDKAIDELSYMSTDAYVEDYDIRDKHWNLLMNILKGGSDYE